MEKIKFYIPLGGKGSQWEDNELRYLLRSLEKNVKCGYTVTIYGEEKPEWVKNVTFLKTERFYPEGHDNMNYENFYDTLNKAYKIAHKKTTPEKFVFLSDDILLLKEINSIDDIKNLPVEASPKSYNELRKNTKHGRTINRAIELAGVKGYNFETHLPRVYETTKLIDLFDKFPFDKYKPPYALSTLYFNYYRQRDGEPLAKENQYKAGFSMEQGNVASYDSTTLKVIEEAVENKMWVNYNDMGLTEVLKKWIEKSFPDAGKHEKK